MFGRRDLLRVDRGRADQSLDVLQRKVHRGMVVSDEAADLSEAGLDPTDTCAGRLPFERAHVLAHLETGVVQGRVP